MATAEKIASDWIAYSHYEPSKAPDDVAESGWILCDLARDDPLLAWEAIKLVVDRYTEQDLLVEDRSEAKRIIASTAAGPLEDLLAEHGLLVIEVVEAEARRNSRMKWAVGCVWQNSMTDVIWARVQRAAGNVSH